MYFPDSSHSEMEATSWIWKTLLFLITFFLLEVLVTFCFVPERTDGDGTISAEVNAGTGMKFPKCLKNYVAYGIPAIIIVIYLKGYYDKFAGLEQHTGRMDDRGTGTAGIRILLCDSEEESETVSGARISARPENNKRCNYV